jgi:hypothetical protein
MEGEMRETRVRGIVIPVEWDAEGNAIKAAIAATNEEEYLIEDGNLEQFLGLIQQEVDVRGTVREHAGRRIITVERCQRPKQHKMYRSLEK